MRIATITNLLLVIALLISLYSCNKKIIYVPSNHIETLTETIRDTILEYKIIPEYKYIQTEDTSSILETTYATSTCKISNGILTHQLNNKDTIVKINTQYKYVYLTKIDSIFYPIKGDTIIKEHTNYTG